MRRALPPLLLLATLVAPAADAAPADLSGWLRRLDAVVDTVHDSLKVARRLTILPVPPAILLEQQAAAAKLADEVESWPARPIGRAGRAACRRAAVDAGAALAAAATGTLAVTAAREGALTVARDTCRRALGGAL